MSAVGRGRGMRPRRIALPQQTISLTAAASPGKASAGIERLQRLFNELKNVRCCPDAAGLLLKLMRDNCIELEQHNQDLVESIMDYVYPEVMSTENAMVRLTLLQLVEMRARNWQHDPAAEQFYASKRLTLANQQQLKLHQFDKGTGDAAASMSRGRTILKTRLYPQVIAMEGDSGAKNGRGAVLGRGGSDQVKTMLPNLSSNAACTADAERGLQRMMMMAAMNNALNPRQLLTDKSTVLLPASLGDVSVIAAAVTATPVGSKQSKANIESKASVVKNAAEVANKTSGGEAGRKTVDATTAGSQLSAGALTPLGDAVALGAGDAAATLTNLTNDASVTVHRNTAGWAGWQIKGGPQQAETVGQSDAKTECDDVKVTGATADCVDGLATDATPNNINAAEPTEATATAIVNKSNKYDREFLLRCGRGVRAEQLPASWPSLCNKFRGICLPPQDVQPATVNLPNEMPSSWTILRSPGQTPNRYM